MNCLKPYFLGKYLKNFKCDLLIFTFVASRVKKPFNWMSYIETGFGILYFNLSFEGKNYQYMCLDNS